MRIDPRFRGPEHSGNGGYVSGALAVALGADAAEITLRSPPPLATELTTRVNGETITLHHGETIVAEGKRAPLVLDVPKSVPFEQASAACEHYVSKTNHAYPTCFVCGPQRDDGLRIFPGAIDRIVAAPWIPENDRKEFLWAALDCPGFFGMYAFSDMSKPLWLLGRLHAQIHQTPHAGERCVVIGWEIERVGRKALTGSAVFGEDGALYGAARGTWIEVSSPRGK